MSNMLRVKKHQKAVNKENKLREDQYLKALTGQTLTPKAPSVEFGITVVARANDDEVQRAEQEYLKSQGKR